MLGQLEQSERPGIGADLAADRRLVSALFLLMAVFLLAKLALLAVLSVNTQFLMDEFPHVQHALLVDQRPYQDVWPFKTLLYAYFYRPAFWLGGSSVDVMQIARLQTFGLALAALILLYGIARNLGRSCLEGLFVLCLALGFSSFMERVFSTRPETLALVFALGALWVVTRWRTGARACLGAGVLSGLAFLTLQKAVYFDLALGLALVGNGLLAGSLRRAMNSGALLLLGWGLAVGLYVAFFALQGAELGAMLHHIFIGPPTRNVTAGHLVYENLRAFVWQTFLRNIAAYALCAIGLAAAVATLGRRSDPERIALIFTIVIAALIYGVHPAPWPYNFIMAIPFLALWGPYALEPFSHRPERIRLLLMGFCILVVGLSFARNVRYLAHDNKYQRQTMAMAESLLLANERYFDGVHMIVTRPHATNFWLQNSLVLSIREAAERGEYGILEEIFAQNPKLVILSYRTQGIVAALAPFLEGSYLPVAPNILLSGSPVVGRGELVFETRWAGSYRLYGADGRPSAAMLLADGREVAGPLRLDLGPHRLRLARQAGPLYLLPANLAPRSVTVLPAPVQERLFSYAHSF